MPNEVLYSAIAALASAVVALWSLRERDHRRWRRDQKEASRLIFALLGRDAERGGPTARQIMPSIDDWDEDTKVSHLQFDRAKQMVKQVVNGDIERLVKDYLRSDPPSDGER